MKKRTNIFTFFLTEKEIEAVKELKEAHSKLIGLPSVKMSDLIRHSLFLYKSIIDSATDKTENRILESCENYHDFGELKRIIMELKAVFSNFEDRKKLVEKMAEAVISEERSSGERLKNKLKKMQK